GYAYADGIITENPETASVVREIFARVLAGESATAIGRDLDRRGIPTTAGGRWVYQTAKIARAPYYTGTWVVDKERGHRIEIPTLVSDADWLAAQARLDHQKLRGLRRTRSEYLLESKMVCGDCGERIGIRVFQGAGRRYYRCDGQRRGS